MEEVRTKNMHLPFGLRSRAQFPFILVIFLLSCLQAVAQTVPGRYIVELSTEPVAEHVAASTLSTKRALSMHTAAAVSHRERIQAEQLSMQDELAGRNASVVGKVNTVANALLVRASDADALRLASVPGVKRVYPVRKLHMVLDRAMLIHKVDEAWNQVGIDHAGEGIKIAIIDSGIDVNHPGFRDASLTAPSTYPRAGAQSDIAYTSGKIIVARSYVSSLPNRDPDLSARDRVGHGTALAMAAAGVRNAGPLATISGVAPKAYLGNYKVFGSPGSNDDTADDVILQAIEDAVVDGMDIINISLGSDLASRLPDDVVVQAAERATRAGVIVVAAAGNAGPQLNTISSPSTSPSVIAVGATTNDRTFATSVEVSGFATYIAKAGDANTSASQAVTGVITDVASLGDDGLACAALPRASLQNKIALIGRGTCTFETKLNNAQQAGAVGAIVYAAQDSPDPIGMSVGGASLPAEMVAYSAGQSIKSRVAGGGSVSATLHFTLSQVPITPSLVTSFSGSGPDVDISIKPDLLAVGSDLYLATQTLDSRGDMYDPSGYILADGTSFASPLVAGAAALVKSARPGLTVDQYRSLLINSATGLQDANGSSIPVQREGAGLLNVINALRVSAAIAPVSVSFGTGGSDPQVTRTVRISNVTSNTQTFSLATQANGNASAPLPSISTLSLAPGAYADVSLSFSGTGLAAGTYDGFLVLTDGSGMQSRVPYWYAVSSQVPSSIVLFEGKTSGRAGSRQTDAILFRVTDAAGIPLPDADVQVTAVSGGGTVRNTHSYDSDVPGLFGVDVRLGNRTGSNVFQVTAGSVSVNVSITGN